MSFVFIKYSIKAHTGSLVNSAKKFISDPAFFSEIKYPLQSQPTSNLNAENKNKKMRANQYSKFLYIFEYVRTKRSK